ncbi:FAD-dependent monooxygenase [Nonomuraea basaltis]|uniref:FAD-dependent monooxygenase n=1 Tax=Nonomuraea basaltis TaxID=2495887 RepID=UPI00110C6323|nr:FAD-dependent monooxygenase [Nonomuraea basaltis]TMR88694.1 FAD-dependent oxidoreductase [Nonomuraea basaltis]
MSADVVIAGGGPNGLMLACELSLAGVRPVVLERRPERTRENRANGLVGQVVRVLERRGLYERLSGSKELPHPAPGFVFGALPLNLSVLEDNPLYLLPVPQLRIEEVLEERAVELDVEIRRGHEITGLSQQDDAVTIEIAGPTGPYRMNARYLVGADGGSSLTRKLAGIGFPGVTRDTAVSRTAHVTVPDTMVDPATGGLNVPGYGHIPPFMHHRTERGLFVYAPLPGKPPLVTTMEWPMDPPGDERPPTLDEMRDSVRRVLGSDLPLGEPTGEGPFLRRRLTGGNTRIADRYRERRILLVGDAAHVHSAIGGPGLNLGLQDAVNLGWKLAAEIRGWAPPGLLDSYETERRPASERVVMHTQAQSALITPGREVTALRELFTELLGDRRNVQHLADMMAGADIRYDMGAGDAHPLIGQWAPDLLLDTSTGPVRLAAFTGDARPLLLDLTKEGSLAGELPEWRDRVDVITARLHDPVTALPHDSATSATALLLRPDCYIAWASASTRPGSDDREGLRAALSRWFGAPA